MNNLFGVQIVGSPLMVRIVQKEVRVPGGYMNRWLIRTFKPETTYTVMHDRINNRIYCHPTMVEKLKGLAL